MKCQRWHVSLLTGRLLLCCLHNRSESQTCEGSYSKSQSEMKNSALQNVESWWAQAESHANSIFSATIYLAVLSWWYSVFNKDCGLVESQSALHRWFTFTWRMFYKPPIISHGKVQQNCFLRKKVVVSKDVLKGKQIKSLLLYTWKKRLKPLFKCSVMLIQFCFCLGNILRQTSLIV